MANLILAICILACVPCVYAVFALYNSTNENENKH